MENRLLGQWLKSSDDGLDITFPTVLHIRYSQVRIIDRRSWVEEVHIILESMTIVQIRCDTMCEKNYLGMQILWSKGTYIRQQAYFDLLVSFVEQQQLQALEVPTNSPKLATSHVFLPLLRDIMVTRYHL